MNASDRLDAVTALFAGPFVTALAVLILVAVVVVLVVERRARVRRDLQLRRRRAIDAHLTHLPR